MLRIVARRVGIAVIVLNAAACRHSINRGRVDPPRRLVELWERRVRAEPEQGEAWERLGHARVAWGDLPRALEAFDRAAELAPHRAEGHRMRAYCLAELGRFDEALRAADEALAAEPECAVAHEARASLMVEAGRFDEARRHATAAGGVRGRILLARVESLAGREAEALAALRAAENAAGDPGAWADIGELYYDLDMLREAQRCYFVATELDLETTHPNAWLGLFRSLANQKRYDEALRHVDRTLERFPRNPFALLMKAALVGILRGHERARPILDEALREHPDDPWVRAQRAWYAFVPLRDFETAIREVERARASTPLPAFESPTYGWLLQLAGRHDEAARVFEDLLARRSRRTLAAHVVEWRQRDFDCLHAVTALRLHGRAREAEGLLRRQLSTPPGAPWARLILRRFAAEPELSLKSVLDAAEYDFQRCEVYFWEGLRLHLEGDRPGARRAMQACRDAGVVHFVEDTFAELTLEGRWPR